MGGSDDSRPDGAGSDTRTLVVALLVMVALIAVGVGSAAVFTRSACDRLDPDPVTAGTAGTDVAAGLATGFPDTDGSVRGSMADALRSLAERLGPVTGIADAGGAQHLVVTDEGPAAAGPITRVLGPTGADVVALADLAEGVVVGSGDTLYSLAVANELTGQVDAILPLDLDLEGRTCVDTALINTPLAFRLAAGDGELLLFRVDEDGAQPGLELRDPVDGRVWETPLDVGIAQPGVHGERLDAGMDAEVVVAGRRTDADDDVPVLTAVDRASGDALWTATRQDLADVVRPELAQRVDVLAVRDGIALVALVPDPDEDVDAQGATASDVGPLLVAMDTSDGALLWHEPLAPQETIQDAAIGDDLVWVVVTGADTSLRLLSFAEDGEPFGSAGTAGTRGRVAALGDDRAVMVGDGASIVWDDGAHALASDLIGRDVVVHPGGVSLLFESEEGGSVVVTFAGPATG